MKPLITLVLAAVALSACSALSNARDPRMDPDQRPHPVGDPRR